MAEKVVTIRTATPQDIPALSAFIAQFVATGELLPRTLDELNDLLPHFFVAELEGEGIVGCATLEVYSKKLAELRSLAVSPKVQGRGVGRALVDACVTRAKELNVFEVMAISASEDFFKKCGFDFTLPNLRKAFFLQTRDTL
jgi:N-acetylglutamate synthase-like GNAT family acetyltransferase